LALFAWLAQSQAYYSDNSSQLQKHLTNTASRSQEGCIRDRAQENLDSYVGLMGMRLVKKSVNQITENSPDSLARSEDA
jgi:hypothetical protein